MYKHLIFGLDGTIADTLPSITDSVNVTLKYFHDPHHYRVDEVYNFVGYGTPYLLKKAFDNEQINLEQVLAIYLPVQLKIHLKKAKLFPDLLLTLNTLKERGYKLYIATNKPIEVAPKVINQLYGKNFFKDAIYQKGDMPVENHLAAFAPAGLTSYIIPDNVKSIGTGAFSQYSELRKIYCKRRCSVL